MIELAVGGRVAEVGAGDGAVAGEAVYERAGLRALAVGHVDGAGRGMVGACLGTLTPSHQVPFRAAPRRTSHSASRRSEGPQSNS